MDFSFRPNRTHIVIDAPLAWASVSQFVAHARCVKTTERIDVLFRVKTLEEPRRVILDEGPDSSTAWKLRRGLDAAFAQSLWPLVLLSVQTMNILIVNQSIVDMCASFFTLLTS